MKITSIEVYSVVLPYSGGVYRLSGGREYTAFDATIVRLCTDIGIDGFGESTPFGSNYIASHHLGVRAGIAQIAPSLLGMDPRQYDRINDQMDNALSGHLDAKTAFDVACWDVAGKAANMRVCDMLGGGIYEPVGLISSIGSDTPDNMRANVAKHRGLGFMAHSLKLAADDPKRDAERLISATSERADGEWYLADANGGLSVEYALRLLRLLPASLDIVLEAPCATWLETEQLAPQCPLPMVLDELILSEADLLHTIRHRLCSGVGIKISKQGGLTRARRLRDMAMAAGLVMSIQDTVGSEIAYAAVLHLAQSTSRKLLRFALDTTSMVTQKTADFPVQVQKCGVITPNTAGLGIKVDRKVLGTPIARYDNYY